MIVRDSDLDHVVIQRHFDPTNGRAWWAEVIEAGQTIGVRRDLLRRAAEEDWPEVSIDGPFLGLCGTHCYEATGDVTEHGDPVYRLVRGSATRQAAR